METSQTTNDASTVLYLFAAVSQINSMANPLPCRQRGLNGQKASIRGLIVKLLVQIVLSSLNCASDEVPAFNTFLFSRPQGPSKFPSSWSASSSSPRPGASSSPCPSSSSGSPPPRAPTSSSSSFPRSWACTSCPWSFS